NWAQASMLDHTDIAIVPSGAMSPVEMSSPTTMSTSAVRFSGKRSGIGGATRFGPRSTVSPDRSASGNACVMLAWCKESMGGARGQQVLVDPGRDDRLEDLARPGGDGHLHRGVNVLVLHQRGHRGEVLVGAVDR